MNVDLFGADSASLPCQAWQVIEAARRQYLTGELILDTNPPTHVYLRDGRAYFAERSTDGGLGVRLLVEGVITRAQLQKGTLLVSGSEHLGRLFERDSTIEREPVELCVELMTDDVLVAVAGEQIAGYRMTMYKRHASGIDRWLPTRVEVITRLVEHTEHADDAVRAELPASPVAAPPPRPAPTPAPVLAPTLAPAFTPAPDPTVHAIAPTISPVAATAILVEQSAGDQYLAGIDFEGSVVDETMSAAIAEEVAEAVRRALAAMDTAQTGSMDFSDLFSGLPSTNAPAA